MIRPEMILSRLNLISAVSLGNKRLISAVSLGNKRLISTTKQLYGAHGLIWYRTPRPPPVNKKNYYLATFLTSFMWWWIFWHLYTDYDHITGEFDYPDPTKWTDEELGIPPDDEDVTVV